MAPGSIGKVDISRWETLEHVQQFSGVRIYLVKTDLAPLVGADLSVMDRDAYKMRSDGPVVFAQSTHDVGVDDVVDHILHTWQAAKSSAVARR